MNTATQCRGQAANKAVYFRIYTFNSRQSTPFLKPSSAKTHFERGWMVVNSNINPPFDDDKSHQMEDQFISSGGDSSNLLLINDSCTSPAHTPIPD